MTTILEQQTITLIILGAVQTKDIATRDGEEHVFYAQFNKSDSIKHVVLIYDQNNSPMWSF
jgi:hypothetical protein